jgi:hypothetical protein
MDMGNDRYHHLQIQRRSDAGGMASCRLLLAVYRCFTLSVTRTKHETSIPQDEQNPSHKYDHLTKLKSLLDEGILTPEEYEAEKEKILKSF